MPRIPSVSPATGKRTESHYIHTLDGNFVDNNGRTLLLRGVNLSGSSKAPLDQPSHLQQELWESGESGDGNFSGRPLNLDDGSADVHLARLRGWGFNMFRFPVTWEALEHEGPGKYDYEFMDYTIRVLRKCKEYGFKVFMDPHQDIWSRFSGGSGAPYWTLPACGMNPHNFTATQSAILHCEYPNAQNPDPATLPAMIWSTNYGRLASQTLFALFFAGRDFAPRCIIDGQNIQDYLQSHYINAFGALADRIRDAGDLFDECVIGWDSMNEPAEGFCGYEDLNVVPDVQGSTLRKGSRPTPAQSLRLGMGQAQTVEHWSFGAFGPRKDGMVTIDPKGYKMWLEPEAEENGVNKRWGWTRDPGWTLGICIWALHGVWDVESGYVLRPDYFKNPPFDPDRPVVFVADYWRQHWRNYVERIRTAHPEAIHFVQPPVFAKPPSTEADDLRGRGCYSGHYYDGLTLVTRHWNWFNADTLGMLRGKYTSMWQAVKIGERAIRKSLQEQLGILKTDAEILGPYPTLIGEIGTPFDMDGKRAYGWTDGGKYTGDYSSQQKALDASLNAADGPNGLSYTIWTYCPDSTHQWGDGWNMEDLSLWSKDDLKATSEYRVRMGDASSATLLKTKSSSALVKMGIEVGSSALSLPTIGGFAEDEQDGRTDGFQERWRNQYDFLTDGARAVRAFARPYPTAVVGVPTDIVFDIAKAEFKLTVRVRAEDKPISRSRSGTELPSSSSSSSSSSSYSDSGKAGGKEKLSALPTEIFVPLVHFARPGLVTSCCAEGQQGEASETGMGSSSRDENANETISQPRSGSSASMSSATLTPTQGPSLVDVDVWVSAGRWEIEGQTLRWWYPIPAAGADVDDVELRHSIQISRTGGPIKTAQDELVAQSAAEGLWQFCDKLCPGDGCCVM